MITLAVKEITDAFKNKLFIIILSMLLLLIIVSVALGSIQVKLNVDSYNQSVELLKSIGKTDLPLAPGFNPLSASKNFANYIGLLGALIAIVLGNAAIEKEKRGGTMRLILSRRIYKGSFLGGKLIGNLALLLAISVFAFAISLLAVVFISSAPVVADDIARLALFFGVAFLYMACFLLVSAFMAILVRGGNRALLITVIIWLVISFVFPQIGDTMDMDNQLPGGFFAAMGMNKADSQVVLDKFKVYETLRDGIEELSPTKHFERAGFALLNVKPGFDKNSALEVLLIKLGDCLALLLPSAILWLAAYLVLRRREDIFGEP